MLDWHFGLVAECLVSAKDWWCLAGFVFREAAEAATLTRQACCPPTEPQLSWLSCPVLLLLLLLFRLCLILNISLLGSVACKTQWLVPGHNSFVEDCMVQLQTAEQSRSHIEKLQGGKTFAAGRGTKWDRKFETDDLKESVWREREKPCIADGRHDGRTCRRDRCFHQPSLLPAWRAAIRLTVITATMRTHARTLTDARTTACGPPGGSAAPGCARPCGGP